MTMKMYRLITVILLIASQSAIAQKGSIYQYGFARIEENEKGWYVDTSGTKIFDQILSSYHPIDSIAPNEQGSNSVFRNEKRLMFLVGKDNKQGMIDDQGKLILQPVYDKIELKWESHLELHLNGKMTYADTWGKPLLPLRFEDAGILDDDHFDVKENGKWGVYSVKEQRMVIPAEYEGFDYCGGCGMKGDYVFAQKNKKWGIVNFKNETIVPFEYEHEHFGMRSDEWVRSFKRNGKAVVLNIKLKKEYGEPEYTDVDLLGSGLLKAKKNGQYGLINNQGITVLDFQYDDIKDPYDQFTSGPFLEIVKNGKTGVVRKDGKVIVSPKFDSDVDCYDQCLVAPRNGNYILLDSLGNSLLAKDYSEISKLDVTANDGQKFQSFKIKQKALYGFYNPINKKLVEPAFHEIEVLGLDTLKVLLGVEYQDKKGIYSIAGDVAVPLGYTNVGSLSVQPPYRLFLVERDKKTGVYDALLKKEIIPLLFSSVDELKTDSNYFKVKKTLPGTGGEEVAGLYDRKGNEVLKPVYTEIKAIGQNNYLLISKTKDKYIYDLFNLSTKKLVPLQYQIVEFSGSPDVLIISDGKNSFLWDAATGKVQSELYPMKNNGEGEALVASISDFKSGLASVEKNGKIGFINTEGKVVIPVDYAGGSFLKNGALLLIKKTEEEKLIYGYADSTGKIIVPLEYHYNQNGYTSDYEKGAYLALFKTDDGDELQGLADLNGKIILKPLYEKVLTDKNEKCLLASKNGKFSIFDPSGKLISKEQYDDVALEEAPFYGSTEVKSSFPALCRKGEEYEYLTLGGQILPLKVKGIIAFTSL